MGATNADHFSPAPHTPLLPVCSPKPLTHEPETLSPRPEFIPAFSRLFPSPSCHPLFPSPLTPPERIARWPGVVGTHTVTATAHTRWTGLPTA